MYMPSDVTKQPLADAAIRGIINGSTAHVINIQYDFGKDWSGDEAIFFHVTLSDQASKEAILDRVTTEVRKRLAEKLREVQIGLFGYSDFRKRATRRATIVRRRRVPAMKQVK